MGNTQDIGGGFQTHDKIPMLKEAGDKMTMISATSKHSSGAAMYYVTTEDDVVATIGLSLGVRDVYHRQLVQSGKGRTDAHDRAIQLTFKRGSLAPGAST